MSPTLQRTIVGLILCSLVLPGALQAQTAGTTPRPAATRPVTTPSATKSRPSTATQGQPAAKSAPAGGQSAAASSKLARPEGEPFRVEKLSPKLEAILKKWEESSAKIQRLTGYHQRYEYDSTFSVEKRSRGTFLYEAPDKGNFVIEAMPIEKGAKTKMMDAEGKPYSIKSGTPERWVCDGKQILKIDDQAKTFERIPIPPESQGTNIIEGPLPFLFGMKAEQAKKRYRLQLDGERTTDSKVFLFAWPNRPEDLQNYQKATVIIQTQDFLPSAVELIHPSGNSRTVHIFSGLAVNKSRIIENLIGGDPLKPNLKAYKEVIKNASATAPAGGPATKAREVGTGPTKVPAGPPSRSAALTNPPPSSAPSKTKSPASPTQK